MPLTFAVCYIPPYPLLTYPNNTLGKEHFTLQLTDNYMHNN
jgi:hypothetical protein